VEFLHRVAIIFQPVTKMHKKEHNRCQDRIRGIYNHNWSNFFKSISVVTGSLSQHVLSDAVKHPILDLPLSGFCAHAHLTTIDNFPPGIKDSLQAWTMDFAGCTEKHQQMCRLVTFCERPMCTLLMQHTIADKPMARVPKMARGNISLVRDIHCCPN